LKCAHLAGRFLAFVEQELSHSAEVIFEPRHRQYGSARWVTWVMQALGVYSSREQSAQGQTQPKCSQPAHHVACKRRRLGTQPT